MTWARPLNKLLFQPPAGYWSASWQDGSPLPHANDPPRTGHGKGDFIGCHGNGTALRVVRLHGDDRNVFAIGSHGGFMRGKMDGSWRACGLNLVGDDLLPALVAARQQRARGII